MTTVCTTLNLNPLGDHHALYVKSNTFLLADVFEGLQEKFNKTYNLDPVQFYSITG